MSLRVTLIQGGGIGFDQAPAVQRILQAAGVAVDWDEHLAGLASSDGQVQHVSRRGGVHPAAHRGGDLRADRIVGGAKRIGPSA